MIEEIEKLIVEAKNICIIPSQNHEPESLSAALALFYTLKQLGKNVNLICDEFPEKLQFLIPSIDFLSSPKNFVISIPRTIANISQVYYEKNEEHLKIHLTTENSRIKKEDIGFYFEQPKPDLVITLGIQDFQKTLAQHLDSFGFLLDTPIVNIDNRQENTKFGKINMIEETSMAQILLEMVGVATTSKEMAHCLLASMVIYYKNFKSAKTNPQTLKLAAQLMEQGANYQQITEHLYKTTQQQMDFLAEIFKYLKNEGGLYISELPQETFGNFGEAEATDAMEKISTLGLQNNLLVLWKSRAQNPMIQGFFYSKNLELLNKINGTMKQGWVFLSEAATDTNSVKEKILNVL